MAGARTLETTGAIASLLGFVASIAMIIFTDFKVAALCSLLIAETVIVAVFWFYARSKNRTCHPYSREDAFDYVRYSFETPTKMSYEVTEVFQVTEPFLQCVPIKLVWSGHGHLRVTSELLKTEIQPKVDGQNGNIEFTLPLPETKRFGDTAIIHYRIDLEDTTGQNKPVLAKNVKRPCRLVIFEVELRYLSECADAELTWRLKDDSDIGQPTVLRRVPFDPVTKSFRTYISDPCVGRKYQLQWKPQ